MRLGVRFDLNEFKRELDAKGRKQVDKAASIALRRVATTVRAVASRGIREKLAISAAVAKKAITIRRDGKKLTMFIEASGAPIPIRDYGAKLGKKGVTYRVSKGDKRKLYENKYGKGFVIEKFGGHVFIRVEPEPKGLKRLFRKRAKIVKAYGPSVPQFFVTRIIRQLLLAKARERWPIEFAAAWRGLSLRGR
jgi:hypothetical protein